MALASVNGVQLYYEIYGAGAETIVFAHGGAGNHLSWWQQVPYFSDRYRCLIFDHRGFGQSSEVENGPGAAAFPEDLRGLMDHVGIERAFLAGQSMGGSTVMGFAIAYPERVAGLILADTTGTIADPELTAMRDKTRAKPGQPPPLDVAYSADFPKNKPELAFLYHALAAVNPPREQTFYVGTRPIPERYLATSERLRTLAVPILFVAGSLDVLATPEIVSRAVSLIPGAVRAEVEGAGHSAYFEDALAWNRAVEAFLSTSAAKASE